MIRPDVVYFKGLNGIRAIASFIVIFAHIDQFSDDLHISSLGFWRNGMAGYAVDMFFVLSGFLITYLLLREKEVTNTISLSKFYLRRIHRIWPLYYLALVLALLLIYTGLMQAPENLFTSFSLYSFLLANVAYISHLSITCIVPLWSVGVEEQFYLVWPHIVKRASGYLNLFFGFYIIFLFLKLIVYSVFGSQSQAYLFMFYTRLNIMCIGAIGAYLVYTNHHMLKILYRIELQAAAWLVLLVSCVYRPLHLFSFIDSDLNALIYLILILNVSSDSKKLISLENNLLNFLGRISFGLYVYHMIIITVFAFVISYFHLSFNTVFVYTSVILTTILVSTISYAFFEQRFMKRKDKFAIVKTASS